MANRAKVSKSEVDRMVKDLTRALTEYDDCMERYKSCLDPIRAEKLLLDTKDHLGKVIRLRHQIKAWLDGKEAKEEPVRDKKDALVQLRHEAETRMEEFDREAVKMKTRPAAKRVAGGTAVEKKEELTVQEQANLETQAWVKQYLAKVRDRKDELELKFEILFTKISTVKSTSAMKQLSTAVHEDDRDVIQTRMDACNFHIYNMELILRGLDNNVLDPLDVDTVRHDLDLFLNGEKNMIDDDMCYDSLDLAAKLGTMAGEVSSVLKGSKEGEDDEMSQDRDTVETAKRKAAAVVKKTKSTATSDKKVNSHEKKPSVTPQIPAPSLVTSNPPPLMTFSAASIVKKSLLTANAQHLLADVHPGPNDIADARIVGNHQQPDEEDVERSLQRKQGEVSLPPEFTKILPQLPPLNDRVGRENTCIPQLIGDASHLPPCDQSGSTIGASTLGLSDNDFGRYVQTQKVREEELLRRLSLPTGSVLPTVNMPAFEYSLDFSVGKIPGRRSDAGRMTLFSTNNQGTMEHVSSKSLNMDNRYAVSLPLTEDEHLLVMLDASAMLESLRLDPSLTDVIVKSAVESGARSEMTQVQIGKLAINLNRNGVRVEIRQKIIKEVSGRIMKKELVM